MRAREDRESVVFVSSPFPVSFEPLECKKSSLRATQYRMMRCGIAKLGPHSPPPSIFEIAKRRRRKDQLNHGVSAFDTSLVFEDDIEGRSR